MYIKNVLYVLLAGYWSYNNPLPQKTALLFTVYLRYILTKYTVTELVFSCVVLVVVVCSSNHLCYVCYTDM